MSCPHGNHPDGCDLCDALTDAYKAGYAAGGIAALSTRPAGLTDEEREALVNDLQKVKQIVAQRLDDTTAIDLLRKINPAIAALRRLAPQAPTAKENQP